MNTTTVLLESWFIPIEIIKIICNCLTIIICILFLCFIIFDKTCHTVPMFLIANTCFSVLVYTCTMLSISSITVQNDLRQIFYQDSLCVIRSYIGNVSGFWLTFSFSIEALYRYMIVVHPTRLFYQTVRFQTMIICLSWLGGIIYPFPYLFSGDIVYQIDDQQCQLKLQFSFFVFYTQLCIYVIPISMTVLLYFRLVYHVKQMNKRVTPVSILSRAQRELKMLQRTLLLVLLLLSLGTPYTIFILMSFFNRAPKYHFRLAYIFVDISLTLFMMALFSLNESLKRSVMRRIYPRRNVVMAVAN